MALQINSIAGIEGAWESFADTYPGLNVPEILARKLCLCSLLTLCSYCSAEAHGIRTADSLRRYCGLEDPEVLEKEAARFEMEIINASKRGGRPGIVPVPGAKEAVHVLEVMAGTLLIASPHSHNYFPDGFFDLREAPLGGLHQRLVCFYQ